MGRSIKKHHKSYVDRHLVNYSVRTNGITLKKKDYQLTNFSKSKNSARLLVKPFRSDSKQLQ